MSVGIGGAAGSGMAAGMGAGTTAGANGSSSWSGIFGAIFGPGTSPNTQNFADNQAEEATKAQQPEDPRPEKDKDDRNKQFEHPVDFLTFSDELMEEAQDDQTGKKPTSIWPPRRT